MLNNKPIVSDLLWLNIEGIVEMAREKWPWKHVKFSEYSLLDSEKKYT